MNMLEEIKQINEKMIEKKTKEKNERGEETLELIEKINSLDKDKLNELMEVANYGFENKLFSASDKLWADGISHEVGFGTSLEVGKYIDKIQILGGGACGDIGIVYSANNFFITNENGNTLDEKSIMLKEENLQEISKIKYPVNMWLKKFLRGVEELRNDWIKWGQNTTYFQKWDVNNEGNAIWLYGSQYMQNIIAPTSESIMTHKSYEKMGMLYIYFSIYVLYCRVFWFFSYLWRFC